MFVWLRFVLVGVFLGVASACAKPAPNAPNAPIVAEPAQTSQSKVISSEILAREPLANRAEVKHILIGWKDLAAGYPGQMDPRAAERSKEDAENFVTEIMGRLQQGDEFEDLMRAASEDSASTASNAVMVVEPNAQLVIEFRQLASRLKLGELGVCESIFGFHIMKRYK